ncbi:hypothetical protein OVA14_09290 [Agrococcus sp. SL85]|uniref:hypothetical protein n=1 Tax=Agrococcus sp. SL85 TaxID=2995141 RepID=UPI00226C9B5C|nr:hypothetical protein [Agrococcus sp. SL85]WAC65542.1 hypothetical protein OVA14_09290 [Agrococcus sp. SL85]
MRVIDWLMEGDPAIRWQVMQDLLEADRAEVAAERARVALEGWGAQLLAARDPGGLWAGGTFFPATEPTSPKQPWTATHPVLVELRLLGLDPESHEARAAIADARRLARWEHDGQPFLEGEVEPCINAALVSNAVHFGERVDGVVERLLGEQMADGGWNCEQEQGSTRGSFDTTIAVVEALLAQERRLEREGGDDRRLRLARERGEAYLLERGLLRRRSTGEVIDEDYLRLAAPPRWHYDVLRALEHLRDAGYEPDDRMREALDVVRGKRRDDGTWPLDVRWGGDAWVEYGTVGEPNRWITMRALRVLRWAGDQA